MFKTFLYLKILIFYLIGEHTHVVWILNCTVLSILFTAALIYPLVLSTCCISRTLYSLSHYLGSNPLLFYTFHFSGTLTGKADFISRESMFLDGGEKRIQSLAKLINYGLAIWGSGDIITENQGDFLNLGKIKMADGASFAGGDLFEVCLCKIMHFLEVVYSGIHSFRIFCSYKLYIYIYLLYNFV